MLCTLFSVPIAPTVSSTACRHVTLIDDHHWPAIVPLPAAAATAPAHSPPPRQRKSRSSHKAQWCDCADLCVAPASSLGHHQTSFYRKRANERQRESVRAWHGSTSQKLLNLLPRLVWAQPVFLVRWEEKKAGPYEGHGGTSHPEFLCEASMFCPVLPVLYVRCRTSLSGSSQR